jgi:hypothetical protein
MAFGCICQGASSQYTRKLVYKYFGLILLFMRILILLLITIWLTLGCREPSNSSFVVPNDATPYNPNTPSAIEKERADETNCDFENGTHSATVDYYNPKTRHTAIYELKVHVKDCKIVQIDFPNGGWLDEDHIPQTQINRNREAMLTDDKGRQWKIHLY